MSDEPQSWVVSKTRCVVCDHRWVAVCEGDTTKLECPACHEAAGFPLPVGEEVDGEA